MLRKSPAKWVPGLTFVQCKGLLDFDEATTTHEFIKLFVKEGLMFRDLTGSFMFTERGNLILAYLRS